MRPGRPSRHHRVMPPGDSGGPASSSKTASKLTATIPTHDHAGMLPATCAMSAVRFFTNPA